MDLADKESIDKFMIPYTEMNNRIFSHMTDRVFEDEARILAKLESVGATEEQKKEYLAYSKLHFYIDDDEAKVRYIVIDSGSPGFGRNGVVEELFAIAKDKGDLGSISELEGRLSNLKLELAEARAEKTGYKGGV